MGDDERGGGRRPDPELLKTRVSAQGIASQDELPRVGGGERVPVLIVLQGHDIGQRFLLNEPTLTVGRHPRAADLMVPGDPEISSVHLRLERAGDTIVVSDHGSTNGTRLNGHGTMLAARRKRGGMASCRPRIAWQRWHLPR